MKTKDKVTKSTKLGLGRFANRPYDRNACP
jgi:hypothetical protein